jgi:hypothetical protein
MTNQDQIASAIMQLGPALDAVCKAEAALAWPESDDTVVDWTDMLARVDRLGQASTLLMGLVRSSVLAPLKELAAVAQARVGQVVELNRLVSLDALLRPAIIQNTVTEAPLRSPLTQTVVDALGPPEESRGQEPDTWAALLVAAEEDDRLTQTDRRVLADLIAVRDRATGKATVSRAHLAMRLQCPEMDVATATVNLRAFGYLRWTRPGTRGPNVYTICRPAPAL